MDDHRFDDLTRALSAPASRRAALRGLAGAALGAVAAALGRDEAAATHTVCRHHGKPCRRAAQCCSGRCTAAGVCKCPTGTTKCGSTACCPAGQTCVNGVCQAACTPNCAGRNCGGDGCNGSCGTCTHPQTCGGGGTPGVCGGVCGACDPATQFCNQFGSCECKVGFPNHCGTFGADLANDDTHCRTCGTDCTKSTDGYTKCCNGDCVKLSGDSRNCGACGNVCPGPNPLCVNSQCQL